MLFRVSCVTRIHCLRCMRFDLNVNNASVWCKWQNSIHCLHSVDTRQNGKKYSRSLKLRLNHWCHMDYLLMSLLRLWTFIMKGTLPGVQTCQKWVIQGESYRLVQKLIAVVVSAIHLCQVTCGVLCWQRNRPVLLILLMDAHSGFPVHYKSEDKKSCSMRVPYAGICHLQRHHPWW